MKSQRRQPQPYPRRSWACPEDLLRRSNFLHGTGSFATKGGWIKTLLGYVIAQYYLLPDSITFWNCTNSHRMVQNTDVQHSTPKLYSSILQGTSPHPCKMEKVCFWKRSCSKTNQNYTESTLKYRAGSTCYYKRPVTGLYFFTRWIAAEHLFWQYLGAKWWKKVSWWIHRKRVGRVGVVAIQIKLYFSKIS